jgi:PleD family two-component response regulator
VRLSEGGWALEDLGSTNGTLLFTRQVERSELWHGDRIGLGRHLLKFALLDEVEVTFQRRLFESAVRDPLTGTFNRRYFMDRLRSELAFAARRASSLSLLLL